MDVNAWLRIEGDTPTARIRNGFPQLIVVGVLVWLGAFVTWQFLGVYLGGVPAALIVLLAGVYVGFDLRDRMIGPVDGPDSNEPAADPETANNHDH